MTDGTLLVTGGAILVNDGTLFVTDGILLLTGMTQLVTDGILLMTDGTLLLTDVILLLTERILLMTDGTLLVTLLDLCFLFEHHNNVHCVQTWEEICVTFIYFYIIIYSHIYKHGGHL